MVAADVGGVPCMRIVSSASTSCGVGSEWIVQVDLPLFVSETIAIRWPAAPFQAVMVAARFAGSHAPVPETGVGVGEAAGALGAVEGLAARVAAAVGPVVGATEGPVVEHAARATARPRARRGVEAAMAGRRGVMWRRMLAAGMKTRRPLKKTPVNDAVVWSDGADGFCMPPRTADIAAMCRSRRAILGP